MLNSTATPKVIENHMDLTPNDLTATVVFDEFRTELIAWLTERQQTMLSPSNKSKGNKTQLQKELVEACADCADYVTDKYLCQKLDPLHSSELVSKVCYTPSSSEPPKTNTLQLTTYESIKSLSLTIQSDRPSPLTPTNPY